MNSDFKLKQFAAGSCLSYILHSQSDALVIDPHISLQKQYVDYLKKNGLVLKYIIDTHTHADHFSLAAVLKKIFNAPVLMFEKAISSVADMRLKDNDEIKIGSASLKVIYTPGHTDDAISLYGDRKVFTGDILLIGSVGRTDFQNGSPESMFDSLQRLKSLPDDTIVFPGHDYHEKRSSTISKEKTDNPFLKETDKAAFVHNMRSKQLSKPFNMDNIIRVNQKGQAAAIEMISPKEAKELADKNPNVKLLDVRSFNEFSEIHIKDSINIPIDMLAGKVQELGRSGETYIVFCRAGTRSPMAADMLLQSGIHSVKAIDGGITAWQKAKLPVIKGEGVISLERQVRIIAGVFILTGTILSLFLHRAFRAVPIFVSCGLIFAGVTDTCLTGMLLMKLPYNQKSYKSKVGGGTCSIS